MQGLLNIKAALYQIGSFNSTYLIAPVRYCSLAKNHCSKTEASRYIFFFLQDQANKIKHMDSFTLEDNFVNFGQNELSFVVSLPSLC